MFIVKGHWQQRACQICSFGLVWGEPDTLGLADTGSFRTFFLLSIRKNKSEQIGYQRPPLLYRPIKKWSAALAEKHLNRVRDTTAFFEGFCSAVEFAKLFEKVELSAESFGNLVIILNDKKRRGGEEVVSKEARKAFLETATKRTSSLTMMMLSPKEEKALAALTKELL